MLQLSVDERRLVAALQVAGRLADADADQRIVAAAVAQVLADFIERWLGKEKPCA